MGLVDCRTRWCNGSAVAKMHRTVKINMFTIVQWSKGYSGGGH